MGICLDGFYVIMKITGSVIGWCLVKTIGELEQNFLG